MPEIKPCPLCGSSAQIARMTRFWFFPIPRYIVWCRECGYYGPVRFTRRGALRAWNKRKDMMAK